MNGIINIYKDAGMTSHDVVNKIRRIAGIKKVGIPEPSIRMRKGIAGLYRQGDKGL